MYEPTGMFTVASAVTKRPILVPTGKDVARGIDPWTGTVRWDKDFTATPGCRQDDWTGETTYLVKDTCTKPAVLEVYDADTGTLLTNWRPPGASGGPDTVTNWF